jgi:hypothetical protein
MSSGNEAQLGIELALGRLRQALYKRLAFMAFCPLVSDQQMSPSLKAVLEGPAPGNLYRVCLDCAPILQSATCDIGRREFNDRSMGRVKARTTNADAFHPFC